MKTWARSFPAWLKTGAWSADSRAACCTRWAPLSHSRSKHTAALYVGNSRVQVQMTGHAAFTYTARKCAQLAYVHTLADAARGLQWVSYL
jgi:hypothetical protein